jgi:hypothetical protein
MERTGPLCPGTYSTHQKYVFSGWPLSTMTPQPCSVCGQRTIPEKINEDWVPGPHVIASGTSLDEHFPTPVHEGTRNSYRTHSR